MRYPYNRGKPNKNQLGNQSLVYIIILISVCFICGASIDMAINKTSINPEAKIFLLSLGDVEEEVLETLKSRLAEIFHLTVEIHDGMNIPPKAYNLRRKQHSSSDILDELHKLVSSNEKKKFLAITGVDLFVPQLNFVFGEAELGGQFAIISLARLQQSFYGLPDDRALFLERTVKEAVHELGHTFGLRHCPDQECVMHFSNSLVDTDRKKALFCFSCLKILEEHEEYQ